MKPVELYRRMFRNSSRPGAKWADPFCGSGTAIIAGEQTARTVYAMDTDPRYVDVAIHRWEQFTGKTATKLTREG
jgi:DNA modification methylase